ncbi:MAG: type II toxin-antitoxin system HicB family antitoxin [Candidatus Micrarchaeota archaeon]
MKKRLTHKRKRKFSAVITKGEVAYVSYCPELGVASQGRTYTEALANLEEAVDLCLEECDLNRGMS